MTITRLLATAAMAALVAPLNAAEAHLYLGAGLDLGGDTLVEVTYDDGSDEKLKAGDGVHFAVGTDIDLGPASMLRATIGYKTRAIAAENGDIEFRRVPLELLGYRFFNNHGIGGGITHHISGKLSCDIDGLCNATADVDDASGVVVEYLYRLRRDDSNRGVSVGVRAVLGLDYEASVSNTAADADSIGVNIGLSL